MVKKTGVFLALMALFDAAGVIAGHHALHLHIGQRLERFEELHILRPLSSGVLSFLSFPSELYLSYSFYINLTSERLDELNKNQTVFLLYLHNSKTRQKDDEPGRFGRAHRL